MKPEPKSNSEIVLYRTEDNRTRIEVRLENETVWLTQKLMAELFQKDTRAINERLRSAAFTPAPGFARARPLS